ncbi:MULTISPECIES: hypothetical protein [unclassified Streptomyces]|uniref:hypothetical protein n=1 Tax=unclassified Streptomyces TaxID=2593676 RepID=UPI0011AFD65E|nr:MULTISPECIES: hypothetical protein [unclassified Streptomyces]
MATYLDAVMAVPHTRNHFWVFVGNNFGAINIENGEPHKDIKQWGPDPLWPALTKVGFTRIDTVIGFLEPPTDDASYWLFSGDRWVVYTLHEGQSPADAPEVSEPQPISDWAALSDKGVGFTRLNATVPVPDKPGQLWVFSEDQWARIQLSPDNNPAKSTVVVGAEIIPSGWASLAEAEFRHVDCAIPVPDQDHEFWVFSGNKWIRVKINDGEPHKDELLYGPGNVSSWKSLADF